MHEVAVERLALLSGDVDAEFGHRADDQRPNMRRLGVEANSVSPHDGSPPP